MSALERLTRYRMRGNSCIKELIFKNVYPCVLSSKVNSSSLGHRILPPRRGKRRSLFMHEPSRAFFTTPCPAEAGTNHRGSVMPGGWGCYGSYAPFNHRGLMLLAPSQTGCLCSHHTKPQSPKPLKPFQPRRSIHALSSICLVSDRHIIEMCRAISWRVGGFKSLKRTTAELHAAAAATAAEVPLDVKSHPFYRRPHTYSRPKTCIPSGVRNFFYRTNRIRRQRQVTFRDVVAFQLSPFPHVGMARRPPQSLGRWSSYATSP